MQAEVKKLHLLRATYLPLSHSCSTPPSLHMITFNFQQTAMKTINTTFNRINNNVYEITNYIKFQITMVHLQGLWSMIYDPWLSGWWYESTQRTYFVCALEVQSCILMLNKDKVEQWVYPSSGRNVGVGLPPSCPITLCQKGCGHANLFPSAP